ncbi:hypothetical protein SDC9_161190 [bioreactor metagenome]|uniref:Uncharacterized protein n=1 Tax=bioreactor metagenome TaxID=1076179 RepID=A0A645FNG8_9ZZZZ
MGRYYNVFWRVVDGGKYPNYVSPYGFSSLHGKALGEGAAVKRNHPKGREFVPQERRDYHIARRAGKTPLGQVIRNKGEGALDFLCIGDGDVSCILTVAYVCPCRGCRHQ